MDPRFVPNEDSPDLYREFTVSFKDGSIKATKDVLLSMFALPEALDTCSPEEIPVRVPQHTRTAYPGAPSRIVQEYNYQKKNYSNGGTSRAAGGEPIGILINGTYWTARLTGSHQAFMDFLCENRGSLSPGFTYWKSQKGKPYAISSSTSGN